MRRNKWLWWGLALLVAGALVVAVADPGSATWGWGPRAVGDGYSVGTGFGPGMMGGTVGPRMMGGGMMGGGMMGGGMMGGWRGRAGVGRAQAGENPRIARQAAVEVAQAYLNRERPRAKVGADGHEFYGYWTLHFEQDGKLAGMLSVNAATGDVWLHTWHASPIEVVGDKHG